MKQDEPLTPLAEGAAALREYFESLRSSGFTRAEALQITIEFMKASMQQNQGGTE